MKTRTIVMLMILSVLLVASTPMEVSHATREFGSGVETYVAVQFMIEKHPAPDMLAFRILHWLTVDQYSMEDVYSLIESEEYGPIPDILKPYYE